MRAKIANEQIHRFVNFSIFCLYHSQHVFCFLSIRTTHNFPVYLIRSQARFALPFRASLACSRIVLRKKKSQIVTVDKPVDNLWITFEPYYKRVENGHFAFDKCFLIQHRYFSDDPHDHLKDQICPLKSERNAQNS